MSTRELNTYLQTGHGRTPERRVSALRKEKRRRMVEMTSDPAIKLFGKKIPLSSSGESTEASGDGVASSGVNSWEDDEGSEKVRFVGYEVSEQFEDCPFLQSTKKI